MKTLFNKCLKNGKISEFKAPKSLIKKELETASSDLKDAKDSFKFKKYKWATIQSYYAMFHAARALIYYKGYREKSHICLISAISALYVDSGFIPQVLVDDFLAGKELRENADYTNDFSLNTSSDIMNSAKEFVKISKKILSNVGII